MCSDESYQVMNKAGRVSFREQLVTAVYEFERCKPEDKQARFYSSKDMQNFRARYLWEVQQQHRKRQLKEATLAALFEDASSSFTEFMKCNTVLNLFSVKKSKT